MVRVAALERGLQLRSRAGTVALMLFEFFDSLSTIEWVVLVVIYLALFG